MSRRLLLILLPSLWVTLRAQRAIAEPIRTTTAPRPSTRVLAELSRRSAVPESELKKLVSNCRANQQSMNFCAFRDQIAAELAFDRAVGEKERKFPACKSEIDSQVAKLERSRDESCQEFAKDTWGNGSMKPVGQAICATKETVRMTREIRRIKGCNRDNSPR